MQLRITLLLFIALSLQACGTTPLSSTELNAVKTGKKAIVRTANIPLLGSMMLGEEAVVQIIAVDHKDIDSDMFKLDGQIALDIGKHVIEFRCRSRKGADDREARELISIDLKPHTEYLVRCSFDSAYASGGGYQTSFHIKERKLK